MLFTKFHGYGNDYLVFESDQLAGVDDLGAFAHRICNRHYGAGGDGIAIVSEPLASAGGSPQPARQQPGWTRGSLAPLRRLPCEVPRSRKM